VNRLVGWLVMSVLVTPMAHAVWLPGFKPSYIQLRPGETVTVRADRVQHGISVGPLVVPTTFASQDPTIATVEGSLTTETSTDVRITALQPGLTRVRIIESGNGPLFPTSPFIVVAEQELSVAIGIDGGLYPWQPITLKAITDEPDATFTWYRGPLDSWLYASYEAGTGPELTFVSPYIGGFDYWVLMQTPQGAGAAGITVKVTEPPRRRAARH
jgi:hypothetical protein